MVSVRRWIGVAGIVVTVVAGTAATVRGAATEFEAEVTLRMPGPPALRSERLRLFHAADVRELVHLRLGETPPLRVMTVTDDLFLVRSRGGTAAQAEEAVKTYAASYVEVRRQQVEADLSAAAELIRHRLDELESQLTSAVGPRRASLVEAVDVFTERLDELHLDRSLRLAPQVVGFTAAEPVDRGARRAWLVAALGATVGLGAAVSARRTGSSTPAGSGDVGGGP